MEPEKMYINGNWTDSHSGKILTVINPYNGDTVGSVPDAEKAEISQAVDAAQDAFISWSALPARTRAGYLKQWHAFMMEEEEAIARMLTLEQGKPLSEAKREVVAAAHFLEWYAEEAVRIYGETIPASTVDKRMTVIRQPVGVVGAITPWNFPASMVARKIAPALAAGCTVILKPASQTPLTAVKMIRLAHKAGIPKGVVNLVTGSSQMIGAVFMADQRVRKITFTGSTEVGKTLMRQSADTLKRVSLELGGHAPYLVFDDADVNSAVKGVLQAKLRNSGQMCVAGNRFYVQEKIYDAFVTKLREQLRKLKSGNGMEPGTDLGPLIDEDAFNKVNAHVEDARNKGAGLLCGGKSRHEGDHKDAGYFFDPTLLTNVTDEMKIMQEETFGPVMAIRRFEKEEEVLRMANDTNYGLAAYVYTESISRGIRVAEQLQFGVVGLNDGGPSAVQAPFGGFKDSGLGREGGSQGLDAFLEIKLISIGLG
ncbi:MAG: NAD-dependent succinate-semialdehyde dehydrogenase [Bacillota bacterium]|nr:NAD-dependent succinate-semialdehyde dehydrogenase [Bacillota bacterium]MDW7676182.1 NAD-dependent succinate-semialdehyde dehydrogenase [Bacillota bacterium]